MYISECREFFDTYHFESDYKLLYELDINSGYINEDKPEVEPIPNVKVCIYSSKEPFTLEKAEDMLIEKYFGAMSVESQDYGYSEYTIEGFSIFSLKIGAHDLLNILNNISGWKIFTVERLKDNERQGK